MSVARDDPPLNGSPRVRSMPSRRASRPGPTEVDASGFAIALEKALAKDPAISYKKTINTYIIVSAVGRAWGTPRRRWYLVPAGSLLTWVSTEHWRWLYGLLEHIVR